MSADGHSAMATRRSTAPGKISNIFYASKNSRPFFLWNVTELVRWLKLYPRSVCNLFFHWAWGMKTGHEDRHVFQFFFVIALIIIARKHQRLRLSKEKKIKRCDTIRINRLNQLHLPSGWLIPDVKKTWPWGLCARAKMRCQSFVARVAYTVFIQQQRSSVPSVYRKLTKTIYR